MIRPARTADLETLARLRHELWPEGPHEEHAGELADFFADVEGSTEVCKRVCRNKCDEDWRFSGAVFVTFEVIV